MLRGFCAVAALLALAACAIPSSPGAPSAANPAPQTAASSTYVPVAFSALPGWDSDRVEEALPALQLGCERLGLLPPDQTLGGADVALAAGGKAGQWLAACSAARALAPGDGAALRAFLTRWFTPYRLQQNGSSAALLTGYYEPEVSGSRTRSRLFQTPLLARPRDLVQVALGDFDPGLTGKVIVGHLSGASLAPYFTRAEIEAGALRSQHLELLYLADPIDAYLVQIQGAARVDLPGGEVVRVAYAGKNGLSYVPIGKLLADQGAIPPDEVSMQTIRAWLESHPDQAKAMMDRNPSYVFFRIVTALADDQGPLGGFGVALTAGRSLAVDRSVVPLGAPMWLATTDPLDGAPVQRLMLAQDTGAAITGPLRADVFYGAGAQAAARAGAARQAGMLFVLLPKG